jgi:hypothetical protein
VSTGLTAWSSGTHAALQKSMPTCISFNFANYRLPGPMLATASRRPVHRSGSPHTARKCYLILTLTPIYLDKKNPYIRIYHRMSWYRIPGKRACHERIL